MYISLTSIASRGIGLEFVKQCLQKGATVIATYRGDSIPTYLQEVKEEIEKEKEKEEEKGSLYCLEMDVGSEESIHGAGKCLTLFFFLSINNVSLLLYLFRMSLFFSYPFRMSLFFSIYS